MTTPALQTPTIGSIVPRAIENATSVAEIQAAEMHTCARKMDGTLWCWGHNEAGQLGNGTKTSSKIAVQVMGLTNVTKFGGGRHHTCAVGTYNGTPGVYCWGRNGRNDRASMTPDTSIGRLGNNSNADSSVPVAVDLSAATGAGQTVTALGVGSYYSCVAMSDNKVWCWGKNANGQLGNGNTTNTKLPAQATLSAITFPANATIDELTCTDGSGYKSASTCMRLSTGDVYCWGAASQLGDGTTVQRLQASTPVSTAGLGSAKFTQLASATDVHCALTSAGEVWCWGNNHQGILGIDDGDFNVTRTSPVKTNVLTGATQLDMSHRTACAVDNQKQVWCWGSNRRGQIRFDSGTALQPTKVPL